MPFCKLARASNVLVAFFHDASRCRGNATLNKFQRGEAVPYGWVSHHNLPF